MLVENLKVEDNDEWSDVAQLAPVIPNGVGDAWTRVDINSQVVDIAFTDRT